MLQAILSNRENFFIAIAWILGGICTVLLVMRGLGSLVEALPRSSSSWEAVYAEKELFTEYSIYYMFTSAVLCIITMNVGPASKVRQVSLAIGGVSSLVYLAFAIPLSGGISYSPLSVTLIYLPTVVAWYLAIHHMPHPSGSIRWIFINSACGYCFLCWLVYCYLIFFSPVGAIAGLLSHSSSADNGSNVTFKVVKGMVVGMELGVAYFFTVIDRAGEFIRSDERAEPPQR